jgi:excisionase family DNA binding protein
VADVAQVLGVSVHTIYGMIPERRLPFRHHKFGGRVLIDRRELERWVCERGIAESGRPPSAHR